MSAPSSPVLSFIVPAVNTLEDLSKTLEAIRRASSNHAVEVCVVSRLGTAFDEAARAAFPEIALLPVAQDTPIPQMRARGFSATHAPLVAVIEDHVQVPPDWVDVALASPASHGDVAAGPVVNLATATLIDRTAFLCEYSHCLPPVTTGQSAWLPGNSTVYPRALLGAHGHLVAAGGWENELHDAIQRAGAHLWFVSELQIGHDKHYTFWEYLSQRYLYARSYAGNRVKGRSWAVRAAWAAATLALPAILLLRIASRVRSRPAYRPTLLSGFPLLAAFVTSWAAGEIVGYLAGAGDALGKVR